MVLYSGQFFYGFQAAHILLCLEIELFFKTIPLNKSSFDFQNKSFEFVELVWVARTAFPSPKHHNMKVFELDTLFTLTSGYADSEYAFKGQFF